MKISPFIVMCVFLVTACGHKMPDKTTNSQDEKNSQNEKKAQAVVMMNQENFPDVNFRGAICRLLPIVEDGPIPEELLSKVEELQLSGLGIKSLKGIEFFTALKQVDCSNNLLQDIDISKNTVLRKLECGHNQLTSIDISNNNMLYGLGCGNNQLTSIDVSKSANLEVLLCHENNIESIDVSHCPKLRELGVVNCELKELDVTNNPDLEELYCTGNKLKELDLSKNTKMKNLYCEQPLFRRINIICPANNPDLGKGTSHTWYDSLVLIWSQEKIN